MIRFSRKQLAGLFGFIMMMRLAGFFISPLLLLKAPWLLLLMSPIILHFGLAAGFLPDLQYYVAGISMGVMHCYIGYLLGNDLSTDAFNWCLENYPRQKKKIYLLRDWIEKSAVISLMLFPGPLLSVLVGSCKMGARKFLALTIVSQALWAVLCKFVGTSIYEIISKAIA